MLLFCLNAVLFCGRLAQLARASRLHREGQEFESLTAYQFKVADLTAAFFYVQRARADMSCGRGGSMG